MGTATKIQWADHTFNPWRGCVEVHSGCDHCYARELARRNQDVLGRWGADGTRVVASESYWRLPANWNRAAEAEGVRSRVFCASLADVFESWQGPMLDSRGVRLWTPVHGYVWDEPIPQTDSIEGCRPLLMVDVRERLFSLIDATPHLDWMLLTKRPENIPKVWPGGYRRNVWLYASVSNQATLDAMMPALVRCRDLGPVLGLSAEPLLGPLDLSRWARPMHRDEAGLPPAPDDDPWISPLDHVIVGGESGPHARPCRPEWIQRIVGQCAKVFVKQLGSNIVTRNDSVEDGFNCDEGWPEPDVAYHIHGFREDYQGADCRIRTRDSKGGDPAEWPKPLRVRNLPGARR